VPGRVLGAVEQQADDRGGQLRAPDRARREHVLGTHRPQLGEGVREGSLEPADQVGGWRRILGDCALAAQCHALGLRQGFPAGVRAQAVEAARQVRDVKPDRRRSTGARPDFGLRECPQQGQEVFGDLEQGVGGGFTWGSVLVRW